MRRMHWIAGVFSVVALSGAYGTGCFFGSSDDCALNLNCGSLTGSSTSTSTSSGAGGGGVSDECVPSANSSAVPDSCGVFVALGGDDANPGTKDAPKKTLGAAITAAKASGGKLYACGQAFQEAVELPSGVALFGALDCMGGWVHKASQRTVIQGSADVVPLKMNKGAGQIRMEDVDVRAADATLPGGSSIALIVDGATVALSRCELVAGNGVAGEKGATPSDDVGTIDNPDDPSIIGGAGTNACMGGVAGNPGAAGKTNALCSDSIGGNGGDGAVEAGNGMSGTDGVPASASGKGKGGAGDSGTGCEPGGYGQDGMVGTPGAGAVDAGSLSPLGYTGVTGAQGVRGGHGQGGGGGGGGKGKVACNGASGGGGGAGGCGGFGGLGGTAGGASIAVVSVNATFTFSDVALKVGGGGKGGDGGDGQLGGIGGSGGKAGLLVAGTTKACAGGDGGSGGVGGQGGGGRGGHSLGIAYVGKSPPSTGVSVTLGMPGAGGLGADMASNGAAGDAKNTLEFPMAAP